jgi:hypothetical protein
MTQHGGKPVAHPTITRRLAMKISWLGWASMISSQTSNGSPWPVNDGPTRFPQRVGPRKSSRGMEKPLVATRSQRKGEPLYYCYESDKEGFIYWDMEREEGMKPKGREAMTSNRQGGCA